jgi:multiple sugar transport system substrate-binding protein
MVEKLAVDKLEFSVSSHFDPQSNWRTALEAFSRGQRLPTEVVVTPWKTARTELLKVALYHYGPDVSEIGTTLVSDFALMNVLRPFVPAEVDLLGGARAFVPAAWQSAVLADNSQAVWAIPLGVDVRVIYYWRDLLSEAGVDERTAFQSPAQMEATLAKIQAHGKVIPWAVETEYSLSSAYQAASWVWARGGDFISADGKRTRFNEPAARAGLADYFRLGRYLPPGAAVLSMEQMAGMFSQRQVAVTMAGLWRLNALRQSGLPPEALAQLGIASPPGPAYVGGANLVIWQHTHHSREAFELVRYLNTKSVAASYAQFSGFLPARMDMLAGPPYSTDPHYQALVQAAKNGRSTARHRLWSLVEEKVSIILHELWAKVLKEPELDLEAALAAQLEPLSHRLDLTLNN